MEFQLERPVKTHPNSPLAGFTHCVPSSGDTINPVRPGPCDVRGRCCWPTRGLSAQGRSIVRTYVSSPYWFLREEQTLRAGAIAIGNPTGPKMPPTQNCITEAVTTCYNHRGPCNLSAEQDWDTILISVVKYGVPISPGMSRLSVAGPGLRKPHCQTEACLTIHPSSSWRCSKTRRLLLLHVPPSISKFMSEIRASRCFISFLVSLIFTVTVTVFSSPGAIDT